MKKSWTCTTGESEALASVQTCLQMESAPRSPSHAMSLSVGSAFLFGCRLLMMASCLAEMRSQKSCENMFLMNAICVDLDVETMSWSLIQSLALRSHISHSLGEHLSCAFSRSATFPTKVCRDMAEEKSPAPPAGAAAWAGAGTGGRPSQRLSFSYRAVSLILAVSRVTLNSLS